MPNNSDKRKAQTLDALALRLQKSFTKIKEDLSPAIGDLIEETKEKAKKANSTPKRTALTLAVFIKLVTLIGDYFDEGFGRRLETSLQKKISRQSKLIKPPPGGRLLGIADFFCSPQTVNLTVLPTVADWRKEVFAALNHQRVWKARWISIRYYFRFIKIFGLDKVLSVIKSFSSAR
jgi:hypothetical protein